MNSKQSKKIATIALVLLMTVSFIPTLAGASGKGSGRHDRGFDKRGSNRGILSIWQNQQLIKDLKLTDEQVNQLREADFSFREKKLEYRAQLDGYRLKMDKAFSESKVDDTVVRSLAEKISDVRGKMFIQKVEARLTLNQYLTAEQIDQLEQYRLDQKKKRTRHGRNSGSGRRSLAWSDNQSRSNDVNE